MSAVTDLPRAFGPPVLSAQLRSQPEDFQVEEVLGFVPDGRGEHLFLSIEKRGANTVWVAGQIARWAGVRDFDVGYAGIKDRHALTRQSFSVYLPGREPDKAFPEHPEFRLLALQRHGRKLQRGALKGNRFVLRLRGVEGERGAIEQRLRQIAERGVPNYFGEQRFGRQGDNVEQARLLFQGRRMRREQASMLLSAVRSEAFNAILSARVRADCWDRPVEGEVFMLDGSHSVFGPEALSDELRDRCARGDIHPTAALWGRDQPRSAAQAAEFDGQHGLDAELLDGLQKAGLRQERRSTRLPVAALAWEWEAPGSLCLRFELQAGSYATSVLHELGLTVDASRAISRNAGDGDQE